MKKREEDIIEAHKDYTSDTSYTWWKRGEQENIVE